MLTRLIVSAIAVGITAWLLPGVNVTPWWATVVVAIVLGLINALIRPIVKFFTLPLNVLTLGLFSLVINALMVLLCDWCTDFMKVDGFFNALLFSIVLTVVNWVLHLLTRKK